MPLENGQETRGSDAADDDLPEQRLLAPDDAAGSSARATGREVQEDEDSRSPRQVISYVLTTIVLGAIYVFISSALIDFNKFMMSPGRFPFALPLVLIHSTTCVVCSGLLFICFPSLFPSLTDPDRKVEINQKIILTGAAPVAFTMSASLVLSNLAYIWSSVAFLQIMKESNVVLVYLFALIASLERFSWNHARILLLLVGATAISVEGEVLFSWMGFLVQGMAMCCECVKVTLQALLLSGGGKKKLDPLAYLLVVMPICVLVLGSTLGLILIVGGTGSRVSAPSWADVQSNWHLLLCNGLVAFSLNLVVAAFMKHTSSVAVILVGIIKDATIVFFNVLFMGEEISSMQKAGFAAQLVLVGIWSAMKTFPKEFEAGFLPLLKNILRGVSPASVELTPAINKAVEP